MRHRNAGFKLGRNTSHRRALLRNLVTSVIVEDRVETTVTKAKAVRPLVEKMITLGKNGDLHSRRQALSFLMTDAVRRAALRYRGAALRATARAAICASSAPDSKRATGRKRPSSNCWAPKSSSTPSARSATRSGPRSAPIWKSSWKKPRPKKLGKPRKKQRRAANRFGVCA